MKLGHLKRIRVAVSLTFLVLTGWMFLAFSDSVPTSWTNSILFLQFVPSVTKFLATFSLSAAGFVVTLLLAALFGRVYCSTICPLGTLQDIISSTSHRLKKKNRHRPIGAFNGLRYSLLVLVTVLALSGTLILLNLLDPFSSFGRMVTTLARPVLLLGNNTLAFALESAGIYALDPVQVKVIAFTVLVVPILTLGLVAWMSYRHGRLYCNTLCPVGTFLGLLSRFSLFRLAINKERCIGCNLCESVCKGGCIDKKQKSLDFTRCVSCYNCLAVCPTDGLEFRGILDKKAPARTETPDYQRRQIMYNSAFFIAASWGSTQTSMKKIISAKETTVVVAKILPIAPPGGRSIASFTGRCTACHLCVSACPSQVLSPSLFEYGLVNFMQPRMDFVAGFCNYECTICSQVCPSGAILPVTLEQKKLTQVGAAKFIKDNCIVYTEEKDCGACSEHCPTKAVRMVPYKKLVAPEVKEEYCIGCGACEHACPTRPFKAIYVDGKAVHTAAKKPEMKKIEEKTLEEFPF